MAPAQRWDSAWSGPIAARMQRPWRRVSPSHAPTPRLPSSIHRDLGRLAAAARAAADAPGTARTRLASEAEEALLRRATLGPTVNDRARIAAIGYKAWLEEQLDHARLDDAALEDALHAALPTLGMTAARLFADYRDNPFIPVLELWTATVYRAMYSPRQLFERMAIFWSDHFSIDIFADFQQLLKPVDDRDVVRAHALGQFPTLLSASAHSPAMLTYLTNDSNTRHHPNENYARELMELHTMGADNGYSEADVKEVARCFTGWTWNDPYRGLGEVGTFRFSRFIHDTDSKVVLGRKIKSSGQAEGEKVLQILAGRPETAEFIATKMLRYLWGYEPDSKAVRKVARSYDKSGGSIRNMVRTALREKQMAAATPKIKRPFHLMISALRAVGAELEDARQVLDNLAAAGHLPFNWAPPNGYPDTAQWWSGRLLPRWDFGATIFIENGVVLNPAVDDPTGGADKIVARIDELLLHGSMTDTTRAELVKFSGKRKSRNRVRQAIGLAVASPEFQEY